MARGVINDNEVMAALQQLIPMQIGRYGQPEEVAQLLRFFLRSLVCVEYFFHEAPFGV